MIRFVTTNEGKFLEVSQLLHAHRIELLRLHRSYPEVQSDSLQEVVAYAVEALAANVEGDFMVDDSGLFVEALHGFPGVYSAYAYRTMGVKGLLCLLADEDWRDARFETVFGLRHGGESRFFRGQCPGSLTREARGPGGFGFDPIFVPEGHERTFAEMATEEKNAVSHRGRAARALAGFLKGR